LNPHARSNGEGGQATVLVVVALGFFMLAALGLGIDGAQIYAQRQMAQAAADAAAEAAIMSMLRGTNSTSAYPFSTAGPFTCTVPPASLDLRTPCVYAQYNGFGTSADTVTVSFPATVAGVSLASAPAAVAVSVQRSLHVGLIQFAGITSSTVSTTATSGMLASVPSNCVYVLDPSAPNAFTASNGASVTMNCGIAINDTNAVAASVTGGANVTSTAVSIAGGYTVNNGGAIHPAPTTGSKTVADPFASVAGPTAGSCSQTNYSLGGGQSKTLTPGTYCNGINISNGATAVFSAGTYIVNGGGITFGGGATITGGGVMFYLTGTNATYSSVTIANGVTVTLSAETSGPYMGLLFFQDRSIVSGSNATFAGGASVQLTGSLYFPTTGVSFSNGATGSADTAIIAKDVSFTGGATLRYDPTGLKTGLIAKTVALVE
jgi:hypothetical protein